MRDNQTQRSLSASLLVLTLLAATGFLIYGNSLSCPFTFDDIPGILDNSSIHVDQLTLKTLDKAAFSNPYTQRPMANLSFAINYYMHQLNVVGYHLVNILLHITNGFLIFLLFRITLYLSTTEKESVPGNNRLSSQTTLSGLAALCWLVHPLHTGSVTYILQRMNVMATTFYLLSLWCYINGRLAQQGSAASTRRSWLFFITAGVAAVCAWGSKQNTASLPFFIIFYEWCFLSRQKNNRQRLKEAGIAIILFGILALIYLGPTPFHAIGSEYTIRPFNLSERLLTQLCLLPFYISLLVFPHPARLNLDYDFPLSTSLTNPATTMIALTALILLAVVTGPLLKKHRLIGWAIICFLSNLVIESSIIPNELIFEHRTYLPSIFLFLAVCHTLRKYLPSRFLFFCILSVFIFFSGFWAIHRNKAWQSNLSLWQDAVDKSPGKARPWHNLAFTYNTNGDFDRAIICYKQSLQLFFQGPQADLTFAVRTYNNMGETYSNSTHYPKARICFNKALALLLRHPKHVYPQIIQVYNNIGFTHTRQKNFTDAATIFKKALHISLRELGEDHPVTGATYNNLGNMYQQKGDYGKAVQYLRNALNVYKQHPELKHENLPAIYTNLGVAYSLSGQYDTAIDYFRRSLELCRETVGEHHPLLAMQYLNLGKAYKAKKEWRQAADYFQRAYVIFHKQWGDDHPYTQQAKQELLQLPPGNASPH